MAPTTIRIVHLSDLHLTAREDGKRSELFGKLTGMNAAFRKVLACQAVQAADKLLVTGDITDSGKLQEWQVFWKAVQAAKVKDRLILVPGNHDLCCLNLRLVLPRSAAAKEDFARLREGLAAGGVVLPGGKYPIALPINDSAVVFVLNSNNMGNATVIDNAVGEIPYFDLERFARLLYRHRQYPVKIVALHHSPNIPGKDTALRRGQKPMGKWQRETHEVPEAQRRALRLLCITHRVRLLVHGHLHQQEDRTVNGIRMIGAPATTEPAIVKDQPCYRFWEYDIAGPSHRMTHRRVCIPA
jgi:predicted phosphodiesterase